MATIVNTPATTDSGNGTGFFLGIVLFIAVIFMLVYFGLPLLQNANVGTAPSVTVPGKIDVNVQGGQGGSQPAK